jgi:anthranilate synthase component 1
LTDEEFKHNVALAKKHCFRGDVFNWFITKVYQGFKGDEFNVYRALEASTPIYSFDYGDFKIFGLHQHKLL